MLNKVDQFEEVVRYFFHKRPKSSAQTMSIIYYNEKQENFVSDELGLCADFHALKHNGNLLLYSVFLRELVFR